MSDRLAERSRLREVREFARWEAPTITPGAVAQRYAEQPSAQDVERVLEQARREGHAAGLKEGRAEGRKAVEQQVRDMGQRVEALLRAMAEPLASIDAAVEKQLVELVLAVSRQVVHLELLLQPEHVAAAVHEAVAALPRAEEAPVQIHLNPQDAALLRELLADTTEDHSGWDLHEDAGVRRGGCRVRRGHAEVDARLETRLAQVFAQLQQQLEPVEQAAEAVQPAPGGAP